MVKYYRWLVDTVCNRYHAKYYSKLLRDLNEREFSWSINRDEDRAIDGITLRRRYVDEIIDNDKKSIPSMQEPCSVLEMMAALSLRIEEDYMHDPRSETNNTTEWFWNMIINLGLDKNDDTNYDPELTDTCLECMLDRRYRRDGKGGLFMVPGLRRDIDMANIDIWSQMNWYISMLEEF
jgi:hypothetical protein